MWHLILAGVSVILRKANFLHFAGNNFCDWQGLVFLAGDKFFLLYLPTQTPFLIGQERVTWHGSKQSNSLGRTKLTNSLGKQQLELSTRT